MTTPHHHHWLKAPFGIAWSHTELELGSNEFFDDPYRVDTIVGPPCTLPCKDEVWS